MGEPLAFQALLDLELRFRGLPKVAQDDFIARRETMSDDEFWEFYEWLTSRQEQAVLDPYAWEIDELGELT
jgi:hypothetical protein